MELFSFHFVIQILNFDDFESEQYSFTQHPSIRFFATIDCENNLWTRISITQWCNNSLPYFPKNIKKYLKKGFEKLFILI